MWFKTFGWTSEVAEKLKGMCGNEVSQMLKDHARREVRKEWVSEAKERSKLGCLRVICKEGVSPGVCKTDLANSEVGQQS